MTILGDTPIGNPQMDGHSMKFPSVFPWDVTSVSPSPGHQDILLPHRRGRQVGDIGATAGLGDGQRAALAACDDVLTKGNGMGWHRIGRLW